MYSAVQGSVLLLPGESEPDRSALGPVYSCRFREALRSVALFRWDRSDAERSWFRFFVLFYRPGRALLGVSRGYFLTTSQWRVNLKTGTNLCGLTLG